MSAHLGVNDVEDIVVANDPLSRGGPGIAVTGVHLTGRRIVLVGMRRYGVAVYDPDGAITLEDLTLSGVREAACAMTTCPIVRGVASGLGAYGGAAMVVSRFAVSSSELAGVQIGPGAAMDLHLGSVRTNVIGANVQELGFDANRLFDQVFYSGNGVNLDRASLPLPPKPPIVSPP